MFVSHPEYQFPMPPALDRPGSQHWRMVELTLHAPWFLLSMEIADADEPECRMTRTLCIAWDIDLAELLRSLDASQVKGFVCMMPAWQSPSGQWSSREVREVWLHRSVSGQHVALYDVSGETFDCGLIPEHVEPVQRELLLKVGVANASPPVPRARGSRPASRARNPEA